jgi:hypothetical protein
MLVLSEVTFRGYDGPGDFPLGARRLLPIGWTHLDSPRLTVHGWVGSSSMPKVPPNASVRSGTGSPIRRLKPHLDVYSLLQFRSGAPGHMLTDPTALVLLLPSCRAAEDDAPVVPTPHEIGPGTLRTPPCLFSLTLAMPMRIDDIGILPRLNRIGILFLRARPPCRAPCTFFPYRSCHKLKGLFI